MNTKQIAAELNVSVGTVKRMVHKGKIPCHRIENGKRCSWKYNLGDVLKAIDK